MLSPVDSCQYALLQWFGVTSLLTLFLSTIMSFSATVGRLASFNPALTIMAAFLAEIPVRSQIRATVGRFTLDEARDERVVR